MDGLNSRSIGRAPEQSGRANVRAIKLAALASCALSQLVGGAAAHAQTASPAAVTELVVTAQRREQQLQDVPISISVLSAESLERASVQSVNDALRAVPGLTFYENNQAAGMTKISVRGVSSNNSIFNGSTTLGYYLDELPFAFVRFPISPDAAAFDLERVEVLRGPQGTLYGANSVNGVVRIMTRDADMSQFGGSARATLSTTTDGGENYRGDLAVNVPLIPGKLAIRGVIGYTDDSGWVDNTFRNVDDVNYGVARNYRLKVNAAPTDHLDMEYLAWISRNKRGGYTLSTDARTISARTAEPNRSDYDAHVLTLTYRFPGFTITSATSYLEFNGFAQFNILGTNDALANRLSSEMRSQEIRLTSLGEGPWRWSLGGIYRDAHDVRRQVFAARIIAPLELHQEYDSKSYAIYGEVTRLFLDERLELTVGARYFRDKNSSEEFGAFTPITGALGRGSEIFEAATPRVVASYHPNEDTTLYASYAQGFRSGFEQDASILRATSGLAPSVEPDLLSNYEAGVKGGVLDGRLNYEFAAYYIDWKDTIQVAAVRVGAVGFNGAFNASAIRGKGIDASFAFHATTALDVGATLSWNDLHFKDNVVSTAASGVQTIVFAKDSRPVESPELTAGAWADYSFPLASGFDGKFTAAIDFVSEMRTVTLVAGAPVQLLGDDLTTVRASFEVRAPGGWRVTVFGNNLTDEGGKVRFADTVFRSQADRLRPRTIGIQLDADF